MCDHPIDLSRRSDSVETRKTPSPSNSSSIETSPSLNNDSPSSLQQRIKRTSAHTNRSNTPTNRYQTASFTSHSYPAMNYTKHDRITPSPPDSLQMHHHYLHGASVPLINSHSSDQAYYLNAVHSQQQKMTNVPSKNGSTSIDGSDGIEIDRKIVRPFKMYAKNPLTLAATIDSSERYDLYRQQIFNQLYPNGDSAISNPKMRRVSRKSFDGSEHSEIDYNNHENDSLAELKQQNDIKNQSDSSSNCGTHENGMTKDKAYYERRRKNNAAAKKSRDRRRLKEDELAVRASFLERENMALRIELDALKKQLEHHAAMAKH